MKLISGMVLLKITADEKAKIFQKEIGDKVLVTAIQQDEDIADSYAQTVGTALVIAVAGDVKHIQPGDIAIIDYQVEKLEDELVSEDETGKLICIDSRTLYHDDDNVSPATLRSNTEKYVWRKGEVDIASMIYAVYRDGKLYPNPPYIICEHKDFQLTLQSEFGITHHQVEYGTVIRCVLEPNVFSEPGVKAGTLVMVQHHTIYERQLDGKSFDIIMDEDIELIIGNE